MKINTWIVIILFFSTYLIHVGYKMYLSMSENEKITFEIPQDHLDLFNDTSVDKFTSKFVYNSKFRFPFSSFEFDHKYNVLINRLAYSKKNPLVDMIKLSKVRSDKSKGVVYHDLGQKCYSFMCNSGKQVLTSDILLTLSGDSLISLRGNGNVCSYSLYMRSMSIRYKLDQDIDVFAEGYPKYGKPAPIFISLIKKGGFIYLIIVSNIDCRNSINLHAVQNIFKFHQNSIEGIESP